MANSSRGYDGSRLKRILTAWTLGSVVVIVMPIILLFVGWIIHRVTCRDGGQGGQWCQQGNNQYAWAYDGWAVTIFAFVWSYLLFVWLAGYGHAVLSHLYGVAEARSGGSLDSRWKRYMCAKNGDGAGPYNIGLLTGATMLFGNLSFLLGMVLAIPLGSGRDIWRRSSIIPLGFLLWALFCLIFSCWLLQFQPVSSYGRDDTASSDYRRAVDGAVDGSTKKKSTSSNKQSSSRGRSKERTSSAQQSGRSSSRNTSGQNDGGKKKGLFSGLRSSRNKSSGENWNNDVSLV